MEQEIDFAPLLLNRGVPGGEPAVVREAFAWLGGRNPAASAG